MPRRVLLPRRFLLPILLLVALTTAAVAQSSGRSSGARRASALQEARYDRFEVIMEGGLVVPTGSMGAEFLSEEGALGAENGFTLGIRTRFFLSRNVSLAPAFSYTEFGDFDGIDVDGAKFVIIPRVLRYGVDLSYLLPGGRRSLRPFFGAGAAVVRNRYHEEFVEEEQTYGAGTNAFAWSLHAGLRWRLWELTVDYERNTFDTPLFLPSAGAVDYDWSRVAIRLGVVLPGL